MTNDKIVFVDACGGALATLATGVATSLGLSAKAATSSDATSIPTEVTQVLEEIGARTTAVARLADVSTDGARVIRLGAPDGWDVWLLSEAPGPLEKLSAARIARDRIERRLDPSWGPPGSKKS